MSQWFSPSLALSRESFLEFLWWYCCCFVSNRRSTHHRQCHQKLEKFWRSVGFEGNRNTIIFSHNFLNFHFLNLSERLVAQAVLPRKETWSCHPLCCDLPQEVRIEGRGSECASILPRRDLVMGQKCGRAWDMVPLWRSMRPWRSPCVSLFEHRGLCPSPMLAQCCECKEKYQRTASSKFAEGRKPTLGSHGHALVEKFVDLEFHLEANLFYHLICLRKDWKQICLPWSDTWEESAAGIIKKEGISPAAWQETAELNRSSFLQREVTEAMEGDRFEVLNCKGVPFSLRDWGGPLWQVWKGQCGASKLCIAMLWVASSLKSLLKLLPISLSVFLFFLLSLLIQCFFSSKVFK